MMDFCCAVVSALVALVLYPVSFARELPQGNRSVWEFGWVNKILCSPYFVSIWFYKGPGNWMQNMFILKGLRSGLGRGYIPLWSLRPPNVRQRGRGSLLQGARRPHGREVWHQLKWISCVKYFSSFFSLLSCFLSSVDIKLFLLVVKKQKWHSVVCKHWSSR